MLDQLLKIVQQNSTDCVVKNKNVPDECNAGVQEEVSNCIISSLSSMASKGNTNEVVQLFGAAASNQTTGISSNPITKVITDNVVSSLGKKFNIPPVVASGIASALLPQVLGQFSKQVADPKDKSIDMNSVIGTLLGGSKSGSSNSSGGIDFNSILGSVLSGGGSKRGSGGGGLDVGGLLGSVLGGRSTKKSPSPKKAAPATRKTTTTGKKVTPAKKTAAKKDQGKDLLGGLLGKILK